MTQDPIQTLTDRNPAELDDVEWTLSENDRARLLERARRSEESLHKPWLTRVPWVARGAVAGTVLVAIGAYLILGGGSAKSPTVGPQFADAAVRVAEVNPRILITGDGWKINHVEPLTPNSGETHFVNGSSDVTITWYPARLYDSYREDRSHQDGPDEESQVLGLDATTVHYGGSDYATMLPPQGDIFIEIRGDLGSKGAYDAMLGSLENTDVDTWLGAMPADTVQPNQQPQLVERLLEGVPLPPGFDGERLENGAVLNPDGVRYKVADDVACGWLDSYAAAEKAGDKAAMAAAVKALAGAGSWPVLQEPPTNGSTRKVILMRADDIARGELDTSFGGAMSVDPDGKSFAFGPAYALSLSCDSITKREIDKPFG